MKKIYLLLVLLFTGLQSVFAQFIWHPDLGTPYAGAISLPWDTRSYMFQVDNGEEFGSPGDIWDALDAQLRAAGITWIRVNSVENRQTELSKCGSIWMKTKITCLVPSTWVTVTVLILSLRN